jgi:hypothetical protein
LSVLSSSSSFTTFGRCAAAAGNDGSRDRPAGRVQQRLSLGARSGRGGRQGQLRTRGLQDPTNDQLEVSAPSWFWKSRPLSAI